MGRNNQIRTETNKKRNKKANETTHKKMKQRCASLKKRNQQD